MSVTGAVEGKSAKLYAGPFVGVRGLKMEARRGRLRSSLFVRGR